MSRFRVWLADVARRFRASSERHSTAIGLTVLIVLALFVYLAPDIIVTIGAGESGVLWKRFAGGTVTVAGDNRPYISRIDADRVGNPIKLTEHIQRHKFRGYKVWPYDEGIHAKFPWDKMYIYNIRLQQVTHGYDVLSNDGLEIKTEITIRWKPVEEDLGKLHRDIGPHYVETMLIPLVGAYAREEIARYPPDALYSPTRLVIQEAIRAKTRAALMSRFYPETKRESYFLIEDILIRSVVLPPEVQLAIKDKVVQKHIAESYRYRLDRERQEAERKAIEAEGIRRFQATINSTISEGYLKWKGIDATLELAKSHNAKVVVIGAGKDGMPIILGGIEGAQVATTPAPPATPP